MKRVGRYILNTLTVLSLVLCLSAAVAWPCSYHFAYGVSRNCPYAFAGGTISRGSLGLLYWRFRGANPNGEIGWRHGSLQATELYVILPKADVDWRVPGAHYVSGAIYEFGMYTRELIVRLWLVIVLASFAPICRAMVWNAGRLRRRRQQGHICAKCDYDLRATPDRCPECGTIPAKVKA